MPTVTPFLWFDDKAEEAARFYVSAFGNARLGEVTRWGEGAPAAPGSVMSVKFTVEGQELIAFNGGPRFQFTPAISLMVSCETQEELDALWDKLLAHGGEPVRCGWLKDRYGLSWQIIPRRLGEVLRHPRAVKAMLDMVKLDLHALEAAAGGS
jgi:predicted 3-demethylubiquinone-9 3-methyltransferase (glyoxalase superfamily)